MARSNNTLRGILWEFEYNAGIDTPASLVLFLKERNLSNDGDNKSLIRSSRDEKGVKLRDGGEEPFVR